MQTSFVVVYDPFWKVPQIQSFDAKPDYINIGSASQLTWQVTDCQAYCNVRIEGRDGIGFAQLVESFPNRSAQGAISVHPTRSTQTRYTLSASNPNGFDAAPKTVTVQLAPSPSQPGATFFFRMENANSSVTNCFTLAIYAPNSDIGRQWAELQNGGFDATEIDESQYLAGC